MYENEILFSFNLNLAYIGKVQKENNKSQNINGLLGVLLGSFFI